MLASVVDSHQQQQQLTLSDLTLHELLGEGAFASVHRASSASIGQQFAVKVVDKCKKASLSAQPLEKEILLHRSLKFHPNVIQLYTVLQEGDIAYLVMELASGGELFQRIEPDVGLCEQLAHFYFSQLIHTLSFIHLNGITHRDIKPENLLLDASGNLKISDFGLSTLFCHNGRRRKLNTVCGSCVYMAPEVLAGEPYDGDAVDIWSAGIVLFVLLAGSAPWDRPSPDTSTEYKHYLSCITHNSFTMNPWNRFSPNILSLLVGILNPDPSKRLTTQQIKTYPWFAQSNPLLDVNYQCVDSNALLSLFASTITPYQSSSPVPNACESWALTQPDFLDTSSMSTQTTLPSTLPSLDMYFSQPEKMIIQSTQPSQGPFTPTTTVTNASTLNLYRLYRFYTHLPPHEAISTISSLLGNFLVPHKPRSATKLTFATVDSRKNPVCGEVSVQSIRSITSETQQQQQQQQQRQSVSLVVFTKSRGCPLEFKRFYRIFVGQLSHIIIQE